MAATIEAGTNGAAPPMGVAVQDIPETTEGGEDLGEDALIAKALSALNDGEAPEVKEPDKPKEVEKPKADGPKPPDGWDEAAASRAFARLTSEQRRFDKRKQEQSSEYTTKVAELESKTKAFESEQKEWRQKVSGASTSPLAALKALGWTYDQLVEYVAKEGIIPTEKLRSDFKVELDEASKASRTELEEIKKELAASKAEKERNAAEQRARDYESRVHSTIDAEIEANPGKYAHLARVPKDRRNSAILAHMVEHYQKNGEALAITDAMLYGEKEAKEYASWYATEAARQEGAVKSANPGAAKPETEARPLTQRDTAVRGVQKEPDDMTDEEREEEAMRILAGG